MMFNVVDKPWGTANNIKIDAFNIAGKTGTCQVDYNSDNIQYISSFVGYFPAEAPQYSCMVLVYKPNKQKGYYGATVAGPVFKEIAQKIYNTTPLEAMVSVDALSTQIPETDYEFPVNDKVPNVEGMTAAEAISLLENLGLNVTLKGVGKVVKQSLRPGKKIKANAKIVLQLA